MQPGINFSQILGMCIFLFILFPGGAEYRAIKPLSYDMFGNVIDRSSKYQNASQMVIAGNNGIGEYLNGSGTESDPYLIEGLHIQGFNSCISIFDTTVHLLIRDCLLECTERSGSKCIDLYSANNIRIESCIIQGGYRGISIQRSQNCIFMNNSIYDCVWGLYAAWTSNGTMQGNRIFRNDRGATFFNSEFLMIKKNVIYRNYYKGLVIGSRTENCTICGNLIGWNRESPQRNLEDNADDNGGVYWDDNESTGNYWSDYDGSGQYPLGGRANSIDRFPHQLVDDAPPYLESPKDIFYEEGTIGHRIQWNTSDAFPCVFEIYLDGQVIHSETWDGSPVILDIDGLENGIHNYTLVVADAVSYIQDSVIVDVFVNVLANLDSETLAVSSFCSVLLVIVMLSIIKKWK